MSEKSNQGETDRRSFLKTLGLGVVAGAAGVMGGCSTGVEKPPSSNIHEGEVPTDKMTYRKDPKTGKPVSLLGYGCMRLPTMPGSTKEDPILDQEAINESVEYAIQHGINYFDTSPRYCKGQSEKAMGIALSRFPRESYYISTKMSNQTAFSREESIDIYKKSLEYLKTDYFDYYLVHAVGDMEKYKARYLDNGIIDFMQEEREKGNIKHLGWSFHGKKEFFDYMMHESDVKWDFVLIQLNYYDWITAKGRSDIDAKYLYEEVEKYGIPAMIMEPLLGGRLAHPNYRAMEILRRADAKASYASWAFRFAGSLPNVLTILSGMTYMEHLRDNIRTFSPLVPLSEAEHKVLDEVAQTMLDFDEINCTGCEYCMPCPYGIDIPGIFAHYNKCLKENNFPIDEQDANYYKARRAFLVSMDRRIPKERQPNHCIKCKKCMPLCPQGIKIPQEMEKIDDFMEHLKQQL